MIGNTRLTWVIFTFLLCLVLGCSPRTGKPALQLSTEKIQTLEEYWPDGALRLRRQALRTSDGTLVNHGTYVRWHDNGQKEYEAVFVHGKKHGIATTWHKNGRIWREEHYRDGQRHGVSSTWDENGIKRKEEKHFDGKPHGTWTVWDKKGRIKTKGYYEHGSPKPWPGGSSDNETAKPPAPSAHSD